MDLHQPYAGVLYLPDRTMRQGTSSVMLADGQTVAQVRWHAMSAHQAFEVLDAADGTVVASGGLEHALGRRYTVHGPDGHQVLADLKLGVLHPFDGATLALADGTTLGMHGRPAGQHFKFLRDGAVIGQIGPTSHTLLTLHPDSYEFALDVPVMSIATAIGLAQTVREAAKAIRAHEHNSNAGFMFN